VSLKSKTEQQQTCVYVEFTDFVFPEFQLQPEAPGTGFLEALTGSPDIDFTDSPKFSKKYFLTGRPEEVIQQLFNKPVREALAGNPGWTIVARKQNLVMYCINQTQPLDQLDSFLSDCLKVFGLLQSSGSQIPVESINAPVTRDSALSEASRIGGLVGALVQREIRRKVIEIDEVATFLKQPVPRKIPRALKNQNRADPFLIVFPGSFCGMGTILFLVGLLADQDLQSRLILMSVASLAILIGGSILSFPRCSPGVACES
jgi:hypothetical protein